MVSVSKGGIGAEKLKSIVERIERLNEEKKDLSDDIKIVFAEAKGQGFDVKIVRQIIRLRKQDIEERMEQEAILDLYKHALGMLPLEQAIVDIEAKNEPK